jgi:GMP synthase-like glutamine amidotransferase
MGGPMSVNDDLPWIARTLALIRQAVSGRLPVLGHCLGGQLVAKALGGAVAANPVKEIGWGEVLVADHPTAHEWFGDALRFDAFHWHGERFSIPPGAVHLLSSPYCENQAFALGDSLGMQCHVEVTADMVRAWCEAGGAELAAAASSPAVQAAIAIERDLEDRIGRLNRVADRIYTRWVQGLRP